MVHLRNRFIFLCLWTCLGFPGPGLLPAYGQLSRPGNPYPMEYEGSPQLRIYELQVTELQKSDALAVDRSSMLKPAKSGLLINTDYSPENAGTWDTVENGLKLWRAAFKVSEATSMNLIFAPYQLHKGVKVFLYNHSRKSVLGAFTDLNNKQVNMLATGTVAGELLVVEMQVPGYLESYGSLGIDAVGCDFSTTAGSAFLKDGWYGASDLCNVDINCSDDSLNQLLKRASVRIIFDGEERCTGTLMHNTRKAGMNYVLTAEHCISTESSANAAVFYFDYESPWCDGPDGSSLKSVSGATLRSTGNSLDFSLLELLEPVPFTYRPFYAGWDWSGSPPAGGVTIHHPLGDVKKISEENHGLSIASFGQGYENNTHWLVRHWESGTTEAGSSGAAFFERNGRVTGTLTGGQANCENSVMDYFQMLSHSWEDFPASGNQLKYWLDPLHKADGYIDGHDPYKDFWTSGDTLSNILPGELLTEETMNLSWGSYSGHNAAYLTEFAELYTIPVSKKIMGVQLNVSHNYIGSQSANLIIRVREGGVLPQEILYEKEIPLADLAEKNINFIEFDSVVSVDGSFFVGYLLHYDSPQDTFSTYMARNRISTPVNTAFVSDGIQWQSLTDFTLGALSTSFAIMPVVYDSLPGPKTDPAFTEAVVAYPNPADSYIWIEFLEITTTPVSISIYNMQGQRIFEEDYGPFQRIILLDGLNYNPGIYFIRINQGDIVHNLKIIQIK